MKVNGMHLAFLDIPKELTEEYNRWNDLDHMPEHVAKDDVFAWSVWCQRRVGD